MKKHSVMDIQHQNLKKFQNQNMKKFPKSYSFLYEELFLPSLRIPQCYARIFSYKRR